MALPEHWKNNGHKRETTGSSYDYLQLRSFSKWELFLKERICSQRERKLSFKSSSLWYDKSLLPHWVPSLECYNFITQVRNYVMGATPMQRMDVDKGQNAKNISLAPKRLLCRKNKLDSQMVIREYDQDTHKLQTNSRGVAMFFIILKSIKWRIQRYLKY